MQFGPRWSPVHSNNIIKVMQFGPRILAQVFSVVDIFFISTDSVQYKNFDAAVLAHCNFEYNDQTIFWMRDRIHTAILTAHHTSMYRKIVRTLLYWLHIIPVCTERSCVHCYIDCTSYQYVQKDRAYTAILTAHYTSMYRKIVRTLLYWLHIISVCTERAELFRVCVRIKKFNNSSQLCDVRRSLYILSVLYCLARVTVNNL